MRVLDRVLGRDISYKTTYYLRDYLFVTYEIF